MKEIHIGDELMLVPETFTSAENLANGKAPKKSMKAKVVYVHPEHRFITVEFEVKDRYGEIHRFKESYTLRKLGGK